MVTQPDDAGFHKSAGLERPSGPGIISKRHTIYHSLTDLCHFVVREMMTQWKNMAQFKFAPESAGR